MTDALSFEKVTFKDIWEEMQPLARAHWVETPNLGDEGKPFSVNNKQLEAIDAAGMLVTYVLRNEGVMIGYAVFMLIPSFDRENSVWARNVTLYVDPTYRGRDIAAKFIQAMEEDLEFEEGVDRIDLQFKPGKTPFTLMQTLGYVPSEAVFSKVFGD